MSSLRKLILKEIKKIENFLLLEAMADLLKDIPGFAKLFSAEGKSAAEIIRGLFKDAKYIKPDEARAFGRFLRNSKEFSFIYFCNNCFDIIKILFSVISRFVNDFESLIPTKIYPETESISVFGGEDLIPPQYGKVFISIKPRFGDFILAKLVDIFSRENINNEASDITITANLSFFILLSNRMVYYP